MRTRGDIGPVAIALGGILAAAGPRKINAENRIMSRKAQPIIISMTPKAMSQPRRFW
jgi:hypothetical protein